MLRIEDIFSCYGRTKIVKIMLENGELTLSEIMRRSNLSYSSAIKHLNFLVNTGLIAEKRFNRIRIFRVDYSSPLINVLNRFISEWGTLSIETPIKTSFS